MNYHKIKLNELQILFKIEFGQEALNWSIRKGWKKKEYAESFDELTEIYDYYTETKGEIKEEVRKSWAKKNKYMLEKFEKMRQL